MNPGHKTPGRLPGWCLVGLLLALPPAFPAWAELDAPLPAGQVSPLAAALEQAWGRHPRAAALMARVAEAEARGELAGAATPGPASLSLSHVNDGLTSSRGRREWEIELSAPLWLPGQKAVRQAEATSAAAEVAARRAALRLEIAGQVREAWWAVTAARSEVDLARRRMESTRALEADVLRLYRAGDLARIDANLAQGERLAAEAELAGMLAALREAEQAWRNLTGAQAPLATEFAAQAERDAPAASEPAREHPRLEAALAAVRAAQARLKVVDASRRDAPELALRLMRERGDVSEPYGNSLGVQFKLPFSSGGRARMASAGASAELAEADAELALARQRLASEVEKARLDLAAAEQQSNLARERRALAGDNLGLAEKAFSLGESDLATLLRIRATAFEAEARVTRQRVTVGSARSRLNQALGVMP